MKTSDLPRGIRAFCAIRVRTTSRPSRIRGRRAAFTLLEMAIVLAILALVTHIAVTRLVDDTYKPRLAQRQIDDIARAIAGSDDERDAEGLPSRSGFLADMGRMPHSLEELWRRPDSDAALYAVRQASLANLGNGDHSDNDVYVACGWRGPYLRLPSGRDRLLDPWGNEYAYTSDATDFVVTSFGSDGVAGWDGHTESAQDIDIAIPRTNTTSLTVTVNIKGTDADAAGEPVELVLRVYGPPGESSHGTVGVVHDRGTTEANATATLRADGLMPGPKVFRIKSADGHRVMGTIHPIVLRPGANHCVVTEFARD